MKVSCAHQHHVNISLRAVLEVSLPALKPLDQRPLLHLLRPLEAHRFTAPGDDDLAGAVLDALQGDVLRRVARPDQQQSLPGELVGVTEVVSVEDPAREPLDTRKVWDVRHREVTCGHDHVVELLGLQHLVLRQVLHADAEGVLLLVILHVPDHSPELDQLPHVFLSPASLEIVEQDLPGWE